ncbi:uncharacterized protein METZ01_LOCUS500288, partial [marine metagenome]
MSKQDYNSTSFDEIFICDSSEIDSIKKDKKKQSDTLVYTKNTNKNIYNLQLPNQEMMGAYVLEENKSLFIPITYDVDRAHLKYVNKMMHLYKDGTLKRTPSGNNIAITSGEMAIIFTKQHVAKPEYEIIRYEAPKIECKVFKYTDKSYENNSKFFQTIRQDGDALGDEEKAINEMDISDEEKKEKRADIYYKIQNLIQDEGEVIRDLE